MKSVGEIAFEIYTSSLVFTHFGENLTLTFDLDLQVKVIGTWVIECAFLGCTFQAETTLMLLRL